MTPTRDPDTLTNGAIRRAAADLAPLLTAARAHLATFRSRVCADCGTVFSPAGRVSNRCLDCAFAEEHDHA